MFLKYLYLIVLFPIVLVCDLGSDCISFWSLLLLHIQIGDFTTRLVYIRRNISIGIPLDLSIPTEMTSIEP